MGITSTYLDDTNSSVRLDFDLDKDLIGMLEGMEFTCEARDPDDFNSTVSTSSSTFREVSGNGKYQEVNITVHSLLLQHHCLSLPLSLTVIASNLWMVR